MAVQKSKKSRARIGNRRSHQKLSLPSIATDEQTGVQHLRHHLSSEGTYRGRLIVAPKVSSSNEGAENFPEE